MEFYKLSTEQALKSLNSSLQGLSTKKAKSLLKIHKKNRIKKTKHFSKLKIFLRQFLDPLVIILIFAVILSLLIPFFKNGNALKFHDTYDSLFIGIILLLIISLVFVSQLIN